MVRADALSVRIDDAADWAAIAARWRDLETRADTSFFLTWDWIGCWLQQSGVSLHLVTVRHQERIVAMALLHESRQFRHGLLRTSALMLHQTGRPATDVITIEHNGMLIDREYGIAPVEAVLGYLLRLDPTAEFPRWDELQLGGFPSPERLESLAGRFGLMTWYHSHKPSRAVDLAEIRASGGSYLDSLSANTRYQIRRSIRLYEKRGPLSATRASGVDEAMRYFDHMKELHQSYWAGRGEPGSFAYPFFEQFHRALVAACLPKGTLELVCIAVGGEPIGYVYNFVHDGWVCAYHTGFRYESDAKLKPGLVSHYLCIMWHLQRGALRYDFLAGDERYKANLARPGPNIAHVVLQRPLLKLRAEMWARQLKNRGRLRWPAGAAVPVPVPAPAPGERGGRRGKALVLGDDTRSFLAIVRSLGRAGIEVHVAPANFASPALKSRYIAGTHYLPFWMADGAQWLQAMEALLRREHFDLIIPCNETTLLPIRHHRERLQRLTRLAIPDDHAIDVLFDKHATRELARAVGVPVSPGRLARPDDSAEAVLAELGAPLVIKERQSYAFDDLHARNKVQFAGSAAELRELLANPRPAGLLYEAFFPGRGAGYSVLASRGKVLQAFEHHRQRESGASGSYYRVSAPFTPALAEGCAAMIAALDYTGVAMFEFRLDSRSGQWLLLEVNARPWGSMPLPVGLGVDFPYRWYTLLVGGTETPEVAYRPGIFGRNLVPDLWASLSDARAAHAGIGGTLKLAASRLAEFRRVFTGREIQDVLVRDDLAPGFREVRELFADLAGRIGRRLPLASPFRRGGAQRALRQALADAGTAPVRLLFVCQGNICRSPFAAAALAARLTAQAGAVSVGSFGMMPRPSRPTPDAGIAAAGARGIDLSRHRSAHLSREEAMAATVIVVFDDINRRAVLERYPDIRAPVLKLGHFLAEPIADINDPIDGDQAVYVATYAVIERAVDRLAVVLAAKRGR